MKTINPRTPELFLLRCFLRGGGYHPPSRISLLTIKYYYFWYGWVAIDVLYWNMSEKVPTVQVFGHSDVRNDVMSKNSENPKNHENQAFFDFFQANLPNIW